MTISATTVLRSRNAAAPERVLSTLLLRYPRWIHAEVMTHRAFSRNAASSRAVPVNKMIRDVLQNPAIPIFWGKNRPGMQASEEHDADVETWDELGNGTGDSVYKEAAWLRARDAAAGAAKAFAEAGYHKQIVNRLLEPFAHITVLVSATEWDNFLELRDHPDAEPHIQMLAREIRKCLEDESTIQTLEPGEWHMPFVTLDDVPTVADAIADETGPNLIEALCKLSVARCASTSYKTVDGFDMTIERAQAIFDKLVNSKPIHASPAEHVAQADWLVDVTLGAWERPHYHGNFVGFCQYRHMI